MMNTLAIAREYVAAGLSVIPIRPDGSKAPALNTWKELQARRPTDAELVQWFAAAKVGIAILCGAVSGNLEVLDFDDLRSFDVWENFLLTRRSPLLGMLPIVTTPRNGRHVYYRLPRVPDGNDKLASRPPTREELAARPKLRAVTLIETRGEGGYVLAPGCPPDCASNGGLYRHVSGPPLTQIPVIEGDAP